MTSESWGVRRGSSRGFRAKSPTSGGRDRQDAGGQHQGHQEAMEHGHDRQEAGGKRQGHQEARQQRIHHQEAGQGGEDAHEAGAEAGIHLEVVEEGEHHLQAGIVKNIQEAARSVIDILEAARQVTDFLKAVRLVTDNLVATRQMPRSGGHWEPELRSGHWEPVSRSGGHWEPRLKPARLLQEMTRAGLLIQGVQVCPHSRNGSRWVKGYNLLGCRQ